MTKAIALIVFAFALSGCQFQKSLIKAGDSLNCAVKPGNIEDWVSLEQHFQKASVHQKRTLIAEARKDSSAVPLAILFSQPESSEAQLKKSLSLFQEMELQSDSNCLTDRYLYVRYQYARGVLVLQQALNGTDLQRKALLVERDSLIEKIEALTEIERDISNQKEEEK